MSPLTTRRQANEIYGRLTGSHYTGEELSVLCGGDDEVLSAVFDDMVREGWEPGLTRDMQDEYWASDLNTANPSESADRRPPPSTGRLSRARLYLLLSNLFI